MFHIYILLFSSTIGPLSTLLSDEPVTASKFLGKMFTEIDPPSKGFPCPACRLDHPEDDDSMDDDSVFEPLSFKEPCEACGEYHEEETPVFTRCEQHAGWEPYVPEDDELTRFPTPTPREDADDSDDTLVTTFEMIHGLQDEEGWSD